MMFPDAEIQMYEVYLKYWTLNLVLAMVYRKVLFHPNFSIKDDVLQAAEWAHRQPALCSPACLC